MKIHFCHSENPVALRAAAELTAKYGNNDITAADVVVSLGGDGTTLDVLRHCLDTQKPLFGLNYGTLGFLQNPPDKTHDLMERLDRAEHFTLRVLRADVHFFNGTTNHFYAVNEVFVFNQHRTQTTHLRLAINDTIYHDKLEGDGVIIATAIGSSGYSHSAGGGIVSLNQDAMIVTPNNQCSRGTKLPSYAFPPSLIDITVLEPVYRPAGLTADTLEITQPIHAVRVQIDPEKKLQLMFDAGYNHHQRVMRALALTNQP